MLAVEGAEPCMRCVMERDPVAQRQVARINKYRGEYDRWERESEERVMMLV